MDRDGQANTAIGCAYTQHSSNVTEVASWNSSHSSSQESSQPRSPWQA
ncbi:hypothetical protein ACFPRL_09045 [Pseudoclavibacter helvolus]